MLKIKVNYDERGAYIKYKNKIYYINSLEKDYKDFIIEKIITEPLDTYAEIVEKVDD